jgi:alanyl-tRNA synthetase
MALFGEKYGDEVRVVMMGDAGDEKMISVELFGGTHVERTGDIGYFKVSGESAISAGVRRIEAVTGEAAEDFSVGFEHTVKTVGASLKCAFGEVTTRVEALQAEIKKLKADLKTAQKGGGASGGKSVADMVKDAEDVNGVRFVSAALENMEAPVMRELVDELKNALGSGGVVLAANNGEKSSIVAGVTADLTKQVRAGDVVNAAAATLGGKGGGRPDMAMAGGQCGDLVAALSAARSVLPA